MRPGKPFLAGLGGSVALATSGAVLAGWAVNSVDARAEIAEFRDELAEAHVSYEGYLEGMDDCAGIVIRGLTAAYAEGGVLDTDATSTAIDAACDVGTEQAEALTRGAVAWQGDIQELQAKIAEGINVMNYSVAEGLQWVNLGAFLGVAAGVYVGDKVQRRHDLRQPEAPNPIDQAVEEARADLQDAAARAHAAADKILGRDDPAR